MGASTAHPAKHCPSRGRGARPDAVPEGAEDAFTDRRTDNTVVVVGSQNRPSPNSSSTASCTATIRTPAASSTYNLLGRREFSSSCVAPMIRDCKTLRRRWPCKDPGTQQPRPAKDLFPGHAHHLRLRSASAWRHAVSYFIATSVNRGRLRLEGGRPVDWRRPGNHFNKSQNPSCIDHDDQESQRDRDTPSTGNREPGVQCPSCG
jgi:1,2-phenylacetyl-CoA epoxidase PaaB subunit